MAIDEASTELRQWRSPVLRTRNAELLLATLLSHPRGLTQRDLRQQTRLAEGTVSGLVTALREAKVVEPDKEVGGGRSRDPQRWSVRSDAAFTVGVSIGLRRVVVVMLDAYGNRVNADARFEQELDTLSDCRATMKVAVKLLKGVVGTRKNCASIAAMTVSLPGPIVDDVLVLPDAPTWDGHNIRADLAERWRKEKLVLPRNVRFERDANAAARGEMLTGQGREQAEDGLLYVHWSNSVAASLVISGSLWKGSRNRAGELGHIKVLVEAAQRRALRLTTNEWTTCPQCHQIDCCEIRVGTPELARAAGAVDPPELLEWAHMQPGSQQRRASDRVLAAGGLLLGRAIGPALTMLDVGAVVIGGAVGRQAFGAVKASIELGVAETANLAAAAKTPILPTALGAEATALGAAHWARDDAGLAFLSAKL